jgi:DNA-binding NtrC family response regulator
VPAPLSQARHTADVSDAVGIIGRVGEGTVLIVDDEPDMVENCARILRRAGYHCLTSTDPFRALALLESDSPDLLLTDL